MEQFEAHLDKHTISRFKYPLVEINTISVFEPHHWFSMGYYAGEVHKLYSDAGDSCVIMQPGERFLSKYLTGTLDYSEWEKNKFYIFDFDEEYPDNVILETSVSNRLQWLGGLVCSKMTSRQERGNMAFSSLDFGFLHDVKRLLATLGLRSSLYSTEKGYYRLTLRNIEVEQLRVMGMPILHKWIFDEPTRHTPLPVYVKKINCLERKERVYQAVDPITHRMMYNLTVTHDGAAK
jgi:hypothetical protein